MASETPSKFVALVVDDDETLRKLMTMILRSHGFEVHSAENQKQGIELVSEKPDAHLLVTDWFLGDGMGGDIVTHLRKTMGNNRMHVLGMSGVVGGRDDPGEMQNYLEKHNQEHPDAPPMHFIAKPFLPKTLYALIDKMGVKTTGKTWRGLIHEMDPVPSSRQGLKTDGKGQTLVRPGKVKPYPMKRFRE